MNLITDLYPLAQKYSTYFDTEPLVYIARHKFNKMPLVRSRIGDVPCSRIIGLTHSQYEDRSWGDLFHKRFQYLDETDVDSTTFGYLKRGKERTADLLKSPKYYLESTPKPNWSFFQIGDFYYINQGNHRTVIARYFYFFNGLPEIIRGVHIDKYALEAGRIREVLGSA